MNVLGFLLNITCCTVFKHILDILSLGPGPGGPPPDNAAPKKIWSEHKTETGKVYFYNSVTKQSVWERPKDMDEEQGSEKKTPEPEQQPPVNSNNAKISEYCVTE